MLSIALAKPTATVTIEGVGRRAASPREHSIHVLLKLSASHARYADKGHVARLARLVLAGFSGGSGEPDRRKVGDVEEWSKSRKGGIVTSTSIVVGVEGSVLWSCRPEEDSVDALRDALVGEGYRVTVRERRECSEPDCKVATMVDWNQPSAVPPGWYSNVTCGGHNYRTCVKCKTVYALTSTNSVGPAPSLHCEVCGRIIVEWGSSKIWRAVRVSRAGT